MATLYVSEFLRMSSDPRAVVPVAETPALVDQAISISSTSAQSAAFGATTRFIRVQSDTACWLLFGANPTATNAKMPLAANVPEYFGVVAGQKVAAITA